MSEFDQKLLINTDGSPRDRIVGFETEYGLTFNVGNRPTLANEAEYFELSLIHNALRRQTTEFRPKGNRIYVDVGTHPEVSTAEEISFKGASTRLTAGHGELVDLFEAIALDEETVFDNVHLMANTCDPQGNSWGSHENFLSTSAISPEDYIPALAAHHISRIVWSGAGHVMVHPRFNSGFRYCLSEKADHIWDLASPSTTHRRPLVNLREEALADDSRFRRVHQVAGETVFSPVANALRLASGSILLRACELGVDFSDLLPIEPVKAIKAISHDISLQTTVELPDGKHFTGLDLQRALAERAISTTSEAGYLTPQEAIWGVKWLEICDNLAIDPKRCLKVVDWVIKQELIERELEAKKDSGSSRHAIAQAKSIDYHALYPQEGAGMKLLRKGFYEMSPTAAEMAGDLPLPATRAQVRGQIIQKLIDANIKFRADWDKVYRNDRENALQLPDPYATHDNRVRFYLKDILNQTEATSIETYVS
jgi:proteasome accessory factor A